MLTSTKSINKLVTTTLTFQLTMTVLTVFVMSCDPGCWHDIHVERWMNFHGIDKELLHQVANNHN